MATTKNKKKSAAAKKTAQRPAKSAKKASKSVSKKSPPKTKPVKKSSITSVKKKTSGKRARKCCIHCPDYSKCDDRGVCCDYCDFFLNTKCTYGKKRGIPSLDEQIELPDYRGDDYGIDDYDAYEPDVD
ncbi:MAG: hypothetical protein KKD39_07955 [Candidatus Altiarchaeota archaeon]|nr:hypothetical protein [Candidatus Altiarchaeota archaeon]